MENRSQRRGRSGALVAGLSLLAITVSSVILAQPPGGQPPPPGGGFGQPGGPGRGPGFQPRMSLAGVPVGALDAELKLSDKQKEDIKQIQDKFHKEQRDLMPNFGPRPGGPPNGGPGSGAPPNGGPPNGPPPNGGFPGGPPNFEQMRANMEKLRGLDEKASKQIEALLTDSQKKQLPDAMKELMALGPAGIPLDILGDLKLSADQKSRIIAVSQKAQQEMREKMRQAQESGDFQSIRQVMQNNRENTDKQIRAILTQDQKTLVDKWLKEHPMRGFGGPGFGGPGGFGPPGFGGPGGGRPGGPPPGGEGPPPPPAV